MVAREKGRLHYDGRAPHGFEGSWDGDGGWGNPVKNHRCCFGRSRAAAMALRATCRRTNITGDTHVPPGILSPSDKINICLVVKIIVHGTNDVTKRWNIRQNVSR